MLRFTESCFSLLFLWRPHNGRWDFPTDECRDANVMTDTIEKIKISRFIMGKYTSLRSRNHEMLPRLGDIQRPHTSDSNDQRGCVWTLLTTCAVKQTHGSVSLGGRVFVEDIRSADASFTRQRRYLVSSQINCETRNDISQPRKKRVCNKQSGGSFLTFI